MPTVFDDRDLHALMARLDRLAPSSPRRWGRMTAPQMIAHLGDQMRHALGDVPTEPVYGPLRWPVVRTLAMFWVPWPKGRIQGPPEAFATAPADWAADVQTLRDLVARFVARGPEAPCGPHAFFGPMRARDWGRFICRHFDHHFRQFGV